MSSLFRGKIAWLLLGCCCLLVPSAQAGWINEIHYDNTGVDVGEFVEIVLEPGEVIGDFSLAYYNGATGGTYSGPTNLNTGAVVNGYSIFWFNGTSVQNGDPDGVALLQGGAVVSGQFLSYEGSFMAMTGAANGLTSTDIGVAETNSTPAGDSLQLNGAGTVYTDFSWSTPSTDSPGAVNANQVLTPEPTSLMLASLGALLAVTTLRRRCRGVSRRTCR